MPNNIVPQGQEILSALLQLTGMPIKGAVQSGLQSGQNARGVIDNSMTNILSNLLQSGNQQNLNSNESGSQGQMTQQFSEQLQQGKQFDEKSLGPLQQNALKTAYKLQSKQIEEAVGQGVPLENILQQMRIPNVPFTPNSAQGDGKPQGEQLPLNENQGMQNPQQTNQGGYNISNPSNILQALIGQTKGTVQDGNVNIQRGGLFNFNNIDNELNRLGASQKLTGQEPLQAGEREKLKIEQEGLRKNIELKASYDIAQELSKTNNPQALTPEASAKFNLIIDGDKSTKEVANLLNIQPGVVWSAPSFLKSQEGRQYESAVKRMITNKLRLESGATISKQDLDEEYKKFRPNRTDSPETIRRKLKPLYEFYQGSLNVADPTGVHRQRAGGSSNGQEQMIGRFKVRYK